MSRAIEILLANQPNTKQDWKKDWKENTRFDFVLDDPLPESEPVDVKSGTVDAIGKNPSNANQILAGTGNPAAGYILTRNEDYGIELGMRFYRIPGNTAAAVADKDDDGIYVVTVPAEPLVQSGGVWRTPWRFYFSAVAGIADISSSLSDFELTLLIDLDPSPDFMDAAAPLVMRYIHSTGEWHAPNGKVLLVRDAGIAAKNGNLALVEQNSINFGFDSLNSFRPVDIPEDWASEEGTYNITLTAKLGGQVVAELKTQVHADPDASWS